MLRSVKNTLIFWTCRALLALGGRLPAGAARWLGSMLGRTAWRCARRARKLAESHAAVAAAHARGFDARAAVHGAFVEAGRCLAEIALLLAGRLDVLEATAMDDASRASLGDALAEGRGVVYVTAHLGHWELMAAGLTARGFPITTIARESYDPRFTTLYERLRAPRRVESIYRGAPGSAAKMLRALRSGSVLGMLLDQSIDVPSVEVPVFGRPASTPRGAAEIALRTGAEVVAGFVHRGPDGRHHIVVRRLPIDRERRDLAAVVAATAAMTRAIEEAIAEHPDQYFGWLHDRWRPTTSGPARAAEAQAADHSTGVSA
ncbi:MAG: lysophospholipid acyltransferase family protein [Deltaproteobacteria bacterium]|nr:lysophospholipid acyltransferase family protein [Deltaproteobacteria bacterium]